MDKQATFSSPPEPRPASKLPTALGFSAVVALIVGLWFLNHNLAGRFPENSPIRYVVAGLIVAMGLVVAIFIASQVNKRRI